jgi:hypothetical protein
MLPQQSKQSFTSTHLAAQSGLKSARKVKMFPKCGGRRPQNLLERKVLQIQPNTTYWKYKGVACASVAAHPDSQQSPDSCLICIPILEVLVGKLELVYSRLYEEVPLLCCLCMSASFKRCFYFMLGLVLFSKMFVCLNFNRRYFILCYLWF